MSRDIANIAMTKLAFEAIGFIYSAVASINTTLHPWPDSFTEDFAQSCSAYTDFWPLERGPVTIGLIKREGGLFWS